MAHRKHIQKKNKVDTTASITLTPVLTEKTSMPSKNAKTVSYAFLVPLHTTKIMVSNAISHLFGIRPLKVNMTRVKGKIKRFKGVVGKRSDRKKAYVIVEAGTSLDMSKVNVEEKKS